MRTVLRLVGTTLIGGLVFLLPIGIVLVVLAHLLAIARRVGDAAHARLFPGAAGDLGPLVFAVLALLVIAFAAGTFARTRAGLRLFAWLEGSVLTRLPIYTVLRQAVADVTGGSVQLTEGRETPVVLVRLDDMTQIGFLIDRPAEGQATVYLPGSPSALSGSVALVDPDRLTATALTPAEVMQSMRRLGAGLAARRS
ncbi:MAG: DUF502 domain-containing protein [Amaricoccus sp.]